MNPFLAKILGSSVKETTESLGNFAVDIREAIKGKEEDPNKKLELISKAIEMQAEINKVEAENPSLFVSGWRPFVGWVSGVSLGFYFIPQYIMASYLWVKMCLAANELLAFPIDSTKIMELLFALLGMGVIRSVDKFNKVASK